MEMIKRMSAKLQDNRGESALGMSLIILGLVLLTGAAMEYHRVFNLFDGITDTVSGAVVSVAAVNCPNVFGGVRESEALARIHDGSSWEQLVSTDDVKDKLIDVLTLTESGDSLIRYTPVKGQENYRIKNLTVNYLNNDGDVLNFESQFTVSIPIYFAGEILPPITKEMKVKSRYESKF